MSAFRARESENIAVKFKNVLQKINGIQSINPQSREKLHLYLDELSSFNYKKTLFSDSEIICKVFLHLVQLVPESDSTLSAKICQLLSRLYRSQSLRLPTASSNAVLNWCLQVMERSGELALLDSMAAIEMLLRGRAVSADPQALSMLLADSGSSSVVGWLKPEKLITLKVVTPAEVELAALRVVKAIAIPNEPGLGGGSLTPARIRRVESCASILMSKLTKSQPLFDLHYYKSIAACLKGMQAVVLQRCSALPLPQGLGLVKAFWLLGLPEHDSSSLPPKPAEPGPPPPSAPSTKGPRKTTQSRSGGAKHVKRVRSALAKVGEDDGMSELPRSRRPMNEEDEDVSTMWLNALSDSEEPSDSDGGTVGASREKQAAHSSVRFAALRLLLLLIKTGDQHSLMSYWDMLMPYSPPGSLPSSRPSLPCCLLRDPYVCSRTAAAQCIAELLLRCQLFLALAESSNGPPLAFTPWSHGLAQALDSCQRFLTLALGSEKVSQCLVTTLGAMAALATVTPYHRLPPGSLTRLARCTRPQLFHKSQEVRAAALAVFAALASSSAATHELAELKSLLCRPQPNSLLGTPTTPAQTASGQEESEEVVCFEDDEDGPVEYLEEEEEAETNVGRTWLVEFCLDALQLPERSKRFRLEPCRVLAALAHSSLWLLLGEGGTVMIRTSAVLAQITVQETDQNVQITASRSLMDLSQSLSTHLQQPGGLVYLNAALEMWSILLKETIPQLAASPSAALRGLACDLLASMGPIVYEHLPREQRLLLAFHLFALSRDSVTSVCTSAVRALGVCVNWPALMEDEQFVLDAAEYVAGALTSKDEWLRSRAAWALGNLGETLVACREKGLAETIPEHLLLKMLESALEACKDDKLKAYAVRGLGNLLRLLSTTQLRRSDCRDLVIRCINAIVDCASSPKPSLMKVRWNACHSLACVLRGAALCEESSLWQASVYPMLCDLVVNSPNFKVRISAAVALAAPSCRANYTNNFLPAWSALLEALASAENVQDFKEFQHRDNLVDQICLSLSHLAKCVSLEDLVGGTSGTLVQLLLAHEHQLRTQLERVRLRLVPEKAEPLSKAFEHLSGLACSATSPGIKEAASQLALVFTVDFQDSLDI